MLALGGASAYGINIVFARMAADAGISGVSVVFYRVLLMLAAVTLIVIVARRSLAVPKGERVAVLLLGLASTTVGVAYISSIAFIPVTVAVVIFYTYPILIVLLSPLVDGGGRRPELLAIAFVAFIGVACVVGPAFGELDWRGIALAAVASASGTLQFFAATRTRRTDTVTKVFWINVMVVPASLGIGLGFGALAPPGALAAAPVVMLLVVATFMIAMLLQLAALVRAPAVVIGLAFCAEPLVASLASALMLGERLGPVQILGGALVIGAIAANVLIENKRRQAERSIAVE
ncbi:MAG TPA: DMT family transporter [Saliniramus sp.]|nr:DMT family transporter [Saliniramus sp.]